MSDIAATKNPKQRSENELSYWGSVFFRLKKNKMAMGSIIILAIIILGCIFIPEISSYEYWATDPSKSNSPPSAEHLFGNDELGRDLFTRFWYAGRISLGIALIVTFFQCIVGIILGAISGFYGKFLDTIIMRLSDIFMSLPFLMICITIVALFGANIPTLIFVLVFLSWPSLARIVRGQILSLREMEYMRACEALGISDFKRIFRHLLPNVFAYVIVYATLNMAGVILTETALSFLGMGISPPTPSWGNMIEAARNMTVLTERWWFWIPPGIGIFASVMCFNLVGDGMRDALDPKMKR